MSTPYRENDFKEGSPPPPRSWWSKRIREEKAFAYWLATVPVLWGLWNLTYFVRGHELLMPNLIVLGILATIIVLFGVVGSFMKMWEAYELRKK